MLYRGLERAVQSLEVFFLKKTCAYPENPLPSQSAARCVCCVRLSNYQKIFTMAVLQNMWLRGAKKKLGGTVLYTQGGRTLQRELAPEVKNPKTPAQMGQRVKWANLVAFYRANSGWMPKAFENKKATQSDYNKFMSLNAASSRIYLTKEQARQGACVVDSYRVSDGTLQPVDIFPTEQNWVTNIYLTGLSKLDATTTVAAFSTALLASNAGLRSGDQLSFIRVTQLFNNTTGIPYVQVRAYELLINEQGPGLLKDFWPIELIGLGQEQETPALMVKNNNKQGGFAIIVSRTQGGRVLVSPSQVTQVNMAAVINQYSSSAALTNAIASYGQGNEVFLDSKGANEIGKMPTTLSITAIANENESIKVAVGGSGNFHNNGWDGSLNVIFNQDITGVVEKLLVTVAGSQFLDVTEGTVTGNTVSFAASIYQDAEKQEEYPVIVSVTISGVTYSAQFTGEATSLT